MRTYGIIQVFRFVEGIWVRQKSRQIQFFRGKKPILLHLSTTYSELPSDISTMQRSDYCRGSELFVIANCHHRMCTTLCPFRALNCTVIRPK